MPEYLAPGVFVEEVSFRAKSIEGVSTTTSGFIGATRYGPVTAAPGLLTSLQDFERLYDPFDPGAALGFGDAPEAPNFLWHAVRAFFAEGGQRLYVSRVFHRLDDAAVAPMDDGADLAVTAAAATYDDGHARVDPAATPGLRVRARHPGACANLRVDFVLQAGADLPVPDPAGDPVSTLTLSIRLLTRDGSRELGRWDDLPVDPRHHRDGLADSVFARFGNSAIGADDAHSLPLVLVRDPAVVTTAFDVVTALFGADPLAAGMQGASFLLDGGNDGKRPRAGDFAGDFAGDAHPDLGHALGLKQFEDMEDISTVAAPGATWKYVDNRAEADATIDHLIAHAERMRYRVALLDSGDGQSIGEIRSLRARLDSRHAALYYPWVTVLDPVGQRQMNLPPSGFVAGLCARNDIERGVHRAPANEGLRLAVGLETLLTKAQQDALNPEGINCFRHFEGRGLRLWGARTISSDPEWKYLHVRRYFAYLERSIDRGTQWAVFEPNGDTLWADVRRSIQDFLLNEWRNGALLGDKPERAYFVRCDRTTMTQNDLDNGRLISLIGVAPLRPAEFIIFRIGQWTADRRI